MYYFAYGSNMSLSRLRQRVPSAIPVGCYVLAGYDLRFHKSSKDGSGKCDAYSTSSTETRMYGVLYQIDAREKLALDKAEGLGNGYAAKEVTVTANDGTSVTAITYIATNIDEKLKPYTWYVNHVLVGANEALLPTDYIEEKIKSVDAVEDGDKVRDAKQRAIHS